MGAILRFFKPPDDALSLFRLPSRREVTLYPQLVPPGNAPLPAREEDTSARLDEPAYFLALERLGPVLVRPVKRGPDRGMLVIEEVPSPVLHYERSLPNDRGELVAGRLWAELEVKGGPGSREGKPYPLKALFLEIQGLFRKSFRRSEPKGFWVGPHAAAAWRCGDLRLRESGKKGRLYGVWR